MEKPDGLRTDRSCEAHHSLLTFALKVPNEPLQCRQMLNYHQVAQLEPQSCPIVIKRETIFCTIKLKVDYLVQNCPIWQHWAFC